MGRVSWPLMSTFSTHFVFGRWKCPIEEYKTLKHFIALKILNRGHSISHRDTDSH